MDEELYQPIGFYERPRLFETVDGYLAKFNQDS